MNRGPLHAVIPAPNKPAEMSPQAAQLIPISRQTSRKPTETNQQPSAETQLAAAQMGRIAETRTPDEDEALIKNKEPDEPMPMQDQALKDFQIGHDLTYSSA